MIDFAIQKLEMSFIQINRGKLKIRARAFIIRFNSSKRLMPLSPNNKYQINMIDHLFLQQNLVQIQSALARARLQMLIYRSFSF